MIDVNRYYFSDNFKIYLLGLSNDGRTNKWRFICKNCNKIHEPTTTILRCQIITCPKCNIKENIDYNNLKENDN